MALPTAQEFRHLRMLASELHAEAARCAMGLRSPTALQVIATKLQTALSDFTDGALASAPSREVTLLDRAVKALADLIFECDGITRTKAPCVGTYNQAFSELESIRAALKAGQSI